MADFSNKQLERLDEIHNAVFELCKILTEKQDLEWDMSYVGEIADTACDILVRSGFTIRYPAIISKFDKNKKWTEEVVDYHSI